MTKSPPVDVLLVEDDPDLRQLLLEELEEAGHRCTACSGIQDARAFLQTQLPQLIVSDLRLPDGNGLTLLENVKQLPLKPGFIAITAFGTIDQAIDDHDVLMDQVDAITNRAGEIAPQPRRQQPVKIQVGQAQDGLVVPPRAVPVYLAVEVRDVPHGAPSRMCQVKTEVTA